MLPLLQVVATGSTPYATTANNIIDSGYVALISSGFAKKNFCKFFTFAKNYCSSVSLLSQVAACFRCTNDHVHVDYRSLLPPQIVLTAVIK